jgi:hypothetical protein
VGALDSRIAALARKISREAQGEPPVPCTVRRPKWGRVCTGIHRASQASRQVCSGLDERIHAIESEMRRSMQALGSALERTETILRVSEHLIESVAESGIETEDTPCIRAAQQAAGQIARLLEDALRSGAGSAADLWDEQYRAVPQHAHLQRPHRPRVGVQAAAFPAADPPPRYGRRRVRGDEGSGSTHQRERPPLGRAVAGVQVLARSVLGHL